MKNPRENPTTAARAHGPVAAWAHQARALAAKVRRLRNELADADVPGEFVDSYIDDTGLLLAAGELDALVASGWKPARAARAGIAVGGSVTLKDGFCFPGMSGTMAVAAIQSKTSKSGESRPVSVTVTLGDGKQAVLPYNMVQAA